MSPALRSQILDDVSHLAHLSILLDHPNSNSLNLSNSLRLLCMAQEEQRAILDGYVCSARLQYSIV